MHQKSLNGFDIRITDDDGELVDFNNIDWAMSLLFKTHHKKIKQNNPQPIPQIKENAEPEPEPESEPKELTDDEILMANE